MKKDKKKSSEVFSSVILITLISIILIITIVLLNILYGYLGRYDTRETNFDKYFKDVTKVVFLNGTEKNSEGYYTGAYYDDKKDIEEISNILNSAVIDKDLSVKSLKKDGIYSMKKYLVIYHKNGTKDVFTFYGKGSFNYKDPEGNYGHLRYEDSDLVMFVHQDERYGCTLTEDLELVEFKKYFDSESFFGKDYYKPWWGY